MAGSKPGSNNGGGVRLFKGRPHEWAGATSHDVHPWRFKADRGVRSTDRLQLTLLGLDPAVPIDALDPFAAHRQTVDDFVEARHLDLAGVDRVLEALDRRRYTRDLETEVAE